jgi:hypothetical protein
MQSHSSQAVMAAPEAGGLPACGQSETPGTCLEFVALVISVYGKIADFSLKEFR